MQKMKYLGTLILLGLGTDYFDWTAHVSLGHAYLLLRKRGDARVQYGIARTLLEDQSKGTISFHDRLKDDYGKLRKVHVRTIFMRKMLREFK